PRRRLRQAAMSTSMLEGKNAVVYGGGGAIGGAAARAFAREGAHVFLAGRTRTKLDAVARSIVQDGGSAEVAEVDALEEPAVEAHADAVAAAAGGIDIALNAVGIHHVQGVPVAQLALADFAHPITDAGRAACACGFRASDHGLHADAFHHREGGGTAYGGETCR